MFADPETIPCEAIDEIGRGDALVMALHLDDEVFGCAGAILSHLRNGNRVSVIVLTDGVPPETPGHIRSPAAEQRSQECVRSAKLLGYGKPIFWHLSDAGVCTASR